MKNKFAQNFTVEDLKQHYRALIGPVPRGMKRRNLVAALRDTEFEEFAYD